MTKFAALLQEFHNAVLEKKPEAFAPAISPNPRISPQEQMAIYVDGYRMRLLEAVQDDYEATLQLLGEEAFNRLAANFIEAHPPTHYSLDYYPQAFAAYLRSHLDDGFACALAALESAIAEVFIMGESDAIDTSALSSLTPETFGSAVLVPRTASALLQLDYPADSCLRQHRKGEEMVRPEAAPSYLYLVRHENEVRRHMLSEAEYRVLKELAASVPVGVALENVAQQHPQLLPEIAAHIQEWFARWTGNGFFQSLTEE
jgi:hypothetical protein